MERYHKTPRVSFKDLKWYREYAKGDEITPCENDIPNDSGTLICIGIKSVEKFIKFKKNYILSKN